MSVAVTPATLVGDLQGVGPRRAQQFRRLGIHNLTDLLRHVPLRYEHEQEEGGILELPMNSVGSARGTIQATRVAHLARRPRFEATLQDHRATLRLVWFNAPYLRQQIHPGMLLRVQGKTQSYQGYPQMVNPRWEQLQDAATPGRSERLRPVYESTEGLPSTVIESLIAQNLPRVAPLIVDPVPTPIIQRLNMPALADAFRMIHQPSHLDEAAAARRRLAYNECLLLQLGIELKRHFNQTALLAPALRWSPAIDRHIRERFPFALTEAQDRCVREIAGDLSRTAPMNRLLQGDVGSGKTVVALYALLMAAAGRRQGAIMTPTELLAEQHFLSIQAMIRDSAVRLVLLTSSSCPPGSEQRRNLLRRIAGGEVDIVVGTQALLTDKVKFHSLAVVVVDEQHRFGVQQRAVLRTPQTPDAKPLTPHSLVMTATPIPRTLSLTVFGDLDVSTIDRLPPGRSPILTRVVGPEKSDEVYRYLAKRVATGEQCYVVVPAIDDQGHESLAQLKSVARHSKDLADKFFHGVKLEFIHGRLKPATRQRIMERFRAGDTRVLVATTVIEVGVDVPNATLMAVEHAERFGLAQLHQLRGRVGRGTGGVNSLCVYIAQTNTEESQKRMAALAATTDGFKIAQADLEIRGMGQFFGTRQSGAADLRLARIPEDLELFEQARRDARSIVAADPTLTRPEHTLLHRKLSQTLGSAIGLVDVG